jgi:membrane fusion protein, multidrug efflux system
VSNRIRIVISVLAIACAALTGTGCKRQQAAAKAGGPPVVPVSVAKAAQESFPVEVRVVGTAEASARVEVKSQVTAPLLRAAFTEGQNVAKGALLFELDARPFQEALRQAEAALARDRAQLRQAEATLARDQAQAKNAEADAARYAELAKAGVVAKAQYDQVRTSADVYRESVRAAQANIESAKAALESDMAAIDKAKLDISYCRIHAPMSGRTGNLLVHPGNLIKANDIPLIVINQVSPMWVNFSVPEQQLGAIRRLSSREKLPVRVSLQDDPSRQAIGQLAVVDNAVDSTTGTIKLKGTFSNADGMLWPGQFVNVTIRLDTIDNATVIPSEAVQNGPQGQLVYVVKNDKSVEPRPVQVGRSFEHKTVIEKGVNPGDIVVTDGHLMLFPGVRVREVDTAKIPGYTM